MATANTLAYYDTATIMAINSFIPHALGGEHLKDASLG
jgi:hypothetical protein